MIAAEVYLWGTRIGVVEQSQVSDIPRFNYDKKFLRSGIEVSPIVMPLSETIYTFPALNKETFHGLPGLLADSLPDRYGTKLVERYLAEQGRNLSDLTAGKLVALLTKTVTNGDKVVGRGKNFILVVLYAKVLSACFKSSHHNFVVIHTCFFVDKDNALRRE